MNAHQEIILTNAETFVRDVFDKQINDHFAFHNIDHTINVANAVKEITAHYPLTNEDEFALKLAALFHDIGFSTHIIENHEKESESIAKHFLENKIAEGIIENVQACIQATKMPQRPLNLIEKLICDADLYHLGTNNFLQFSKRLKKEREQYFNIVISDEDWRQRNIQFLESHKYFTRYCREHLEPVKQQWLQKLKNG